ncbi:MAG: glycosyltransferase [Desulfurivibrionaceae bacterium]
MTRKRLLILSNNPLRASFRQRIGIYLDRLTEAGIEWRLEKLPKSYLNRWHLLRQAKDYDAVLLHKKTLNIWDARILRNSARSIIYDFDDAIMYSPRQPEKDNTSHFRLFRRTAGISDLAIAGNDYLADLARPFSSNVEILPTGLDLSEYQEIDSQQPDSYIRLVWIGSRATLKYLADIAPALEEIGRMDNSVILRIICDDFLEMDSMPVEKCSWSMQTQIKDLSECDIGLAPLPDNRFTRGKCGFKVLQYFAAGLPTVASPVEINGKLISESGAGLTAEDPEQWKESLLKLIRDSSLRKKQGSNAQQYINNYGLEPVGSRFIEIIRSVI